MKFERWLYPLLAAAILCVAAPLSAQDPLSVIEDTEAELERFADFLSGRHGTIEKELVDASFTSARRIARDRGTAVSPAFEDLLVDELDQAQSKIQLSSVGSCTTTCVTVLSVRRAVTSLQDELAALKNRRLRYDIRVESTPNQGSIELLFRDGSPALGGPRFTNDVLQSIYIGKYELIVRKDGFHDARYSFDLRNSPIETIACEMNPSAHSTVSVCRGQ